jgi:N-acetylated-alpha-linked acidic dipeptidase
MEEKTLVEQKLAKGDIPVPVTHRPSSVTSPRKKWGRRVALTLAFLWTLHLLSNVEHIRHNRHEEQEHGMLNALTHAAKKGHVLKRKGAEQLFLYVTILFTQKSGTLTDETNLLRSIPDEDSAIATSRVYAAKPHMAGTAGDLDTAKTFLAHLQEELQINQSSSDIPLYSAGSHESREATLTISSLDEPKAWIDVYHPILNSPLDHSLEILGDDGTAVWSAELEEVADETDPYAFESANAVPTWHGISRGGQAEGKLIYAHYGRKRDYDALVQAGP